MLFWTNNSSPSASVRAGFVHSQYEVRERNGIVLVCVGAFEPEKFGARFNLTANTRDGTASKTTTTNIEMKS